MLPENSKTRPVQPDSFDIVGLDGRGALNCLGSCPQPVRCFVVVAAGAKRIYGIVGDSLNGLTDAFRRQDKIEWIHVRHEEVAAFAAGAEAHATGELAVCAGSCWLPFCSFTVDVAIIAIPL
jgi:hypothetical protein